MNKSWIGIIFYLIFVGIITYFIASYTEAEKVQEFLYLNREYIKSDNRILLSATTLANSNDGTKAYVYKDALFEETFTDGENKVTISIYSYVTVNRSKVDNYFGIILKDLVINQDDLLTGDYNETIILTDLVFNQNVTYNGETKKVFTEMYITGYEDSLKIMTIPYDKLQAENVIELEKITMHYVLKNGSTPTFVELYNSDLNPSLTGDEFELTFNRDIKNLSSSYLKLKEKYGVNNIVGNPELFFDDSLQSKLESLNVLYLKNIGLELLFLFPITYFLFVHKYVLMKLRAKKQDKKKSIETEVLKLKKEIETKKGDES